MPRFGRPNEIIHGGVRVLVQPMKRPESSLLFEVYKKGGLREKAIDAALKGKKREEK